MSRWVGVLCLLAACDMAKAPPGPPARPRGEDTRSSRPEPAANPAAAGPTARPATPIALRLPEGEAAEAPTTGQPGAAAPDEAPADAPAEPVRDLTAELRSAMGNPAGCLTPRVSGQGPDHLSISVSATVTVSGMVTRAEVSSAALSEGELVCLRKRALGLRLQAPIDDAPRGIATTITLDRQP